MADGPVLVAIDVARICGVAYGAVTFAYPVTLRIVLPKDDKHDPVGRRMVTLYRELSELFEAHRPRWAVMAERFVGRNMHEVEALLALDGVARMVCREREIKLMRQPENTVRKEILGKGNGPSEEMKKRAVAWCEAQGIAVEDANCADAAVLWRWTRDELLRQGRLAA